MNATFKLSSTQFNLRNEDKQLILDFLKEIPNEWLSFYGKEMDSHITIKYGLHDQIPNNLSELIKEQQPVRVVLDKITMFENDEFNVLKIDVLSQDLRKLNKLISDNMETTDTHLVYKPHLTLAYLQKDYGKEFVGDTRFQGKQLMFDNLVFSPADDLEDTIIYFERGFENV